jgi:voltage-gated potassium channel
MDLEMGEISVGASSTAAGKTIEGSRLRQDSGVMILAIKRSQEMGFNSSSDDRIEPGHFLIAMGQTSQLRRREQMASPS